MSDAATAKTALVVEDEMLFRLQVRDLLEADGYAVIEAGSSAQALERLDGAVSLMVVGIRMPGPGDGLALAREVGRSLIRPPEEVRPEVWLSSRDEDGQMGTQRHEPEDVVAQLRPADVLVSQGQSVGDTIRATEVTYDRRHKE